LYLPWFLKKSAQDRKTQNLSRHLWPVQRWLLDRQTLKFFCQLVPVVSKFWGRFMGMDTHENETDTKAAKQKGNMNYHHHLCS
jgi:hypothetical protein